MGHLIVRSSVVLSAGGGGGAAGTFAPNLPVGQTIFIDRQWNLAEKTYSDSLSGVDPYGMFWYGDVPPLIATPANLSAFVGATVGAMPDGNATGMAIKWPSGFSSGQRPFGCSYTGTISVKQLYHAVWVWMPAGFNPNSNNIKWIFFARNGAGRNHVWMMSSGATGAMIAAWLALQGGGNGSLNVGGAGNGKTGANYTLSSVSNVDGCWDYRRAGWYCVEFLSRMETSLNAGDGIFKSWFNGTLINDFRNLNYSASGDPTVMDDASFEPFYGGGGSDAPADEYLVMGRFLVAGGN